VGQRLGVHHQTVQRCVERAVAYGALAALDDRPRPSATVRRPFLILSLSTLLFAHLLPCSYLGSPFLAF
jgi:hypothetical protein